METSNNLTVLHDFATRMVLAQKLGVQYGGKRDIYEALGYPKDITFDDYFVHYKRQDIASAVIDRPINTMWRGEVTLEEGGEDAKETETAFEKKWMALWDELKLKKQLIRLDKLAALGKYALLLLGTSDLKTADNYKDPLKGTPKLLYVKPFGGNSVSVHKYNEDVNSPRFGEPETYKIVIGKLRSTNELIVHHTRVLHVAYDILEDEHEGTPELQKIYNRLLDMEKIAGGSAEMYWRGARPGYQGKVDKDYTFDDGTMKQLQKQIDEFEHNLRRIIINEGVELQSLAQQVSDPTKHVDVQVNLISAKTSIPKRILMGSERGELASSQDMDAWYSLIVGRRAEIGEALILRPLIEKLMELKVLPNVQSWKIVWTSLHEVSEKDKAEVAKIKSEALGKYASSAMAMDVIPPRSYMKYFLNLDEETIDKILAEVDGMNFNEDDDLPLNDE